MATSKAIGIDLGTTNSCVGVYEHGYVTILTSEFDGLRTTPSVVTFTDDGEFDVGQSAKEEMVSNPTNTIYGIKRLIGKKFEDVQEDIKVLPFKVSQGRNERIAVEVNVGGRKKKYCPEQISAFILKDLKKMAEKYLGHKVKDAVITVPAYFNDAQRQATIDAGKCARLNVLKIISEPTAAALAFGYKEGKEETVLVFDLGGGTFDVSIIKTRDGCCEVLAVAGDTHLGGEDFDNILVQHCIEQFQGTYGFTLPINPEARCKLKFACESAKRVLSRNKSAKVRVPCFSGNIDLFVTIEQERFTGLCRKLNDRTIAPITKALKDAKLKRSAINEIILVGGSTKIPFIQNTIKNFFGDKKVKSNINPEEAVAIGATLCAAHHSNTIDAGIRGILLVDVIPHSIGTDCMTPRGNKFNQIVVNRNTQIPFAVPFTFLTREDDQTEMHFDVFEGEDREIKNVNLLGTFVLTNITPAPAGQREIEAIFEVDNNGVLTVSAVDATNGSTNSIKLHPYKGRLTEVEIIRISENLDPANTSNNDDDIV